MKKYRVLVSFITFFYLALTPANALTQQQLKMLDQLDQLEKLDHMEFIDLNDEANSCVFSRDFTCAENKIAKAKKLASSTSEKNLLQNTRLNLQNERQRIADEERQRIQEERRLAEAEEEMQRAQRRAQEEDEDRGPSTAEMIQQFGTLFAQQYSNNLAEKRASMQLANEITRKRNSDYEAANNRLQESFAKQKAQIEANRIARDRLEQQRQAELLRQQQLAKASQIEIPKFVPQTIVIPTGRTSCPPGSSPARQKNGQYVTSPPEAYCIKDSLNDKNIPLAFNTNTSKQDSSKSQQTKSNNNSDNGYDSNNVNAPVNTAAYKSTKSMQRIATDPNPYKNDFDWRDVGFAISTTRQGACQDAKAQANSEIARLKSVENPPIITAESPCVCFDNFLAYGKIDDGTITCHVYIKTENPKRSGPTSSVAR